MHISLPAVHCDDDLRTPWMAELWKWEPGRSANNDPGLSNNFRCTPVKERNWPSCERKCNGFRLRWIILVSIFQYATTASHTSRCRPTFVRIISGPPSRRSSRRLRRELIHFQLILNGPYYLFITDTTTLSKSLNTYFVFSPNDRCDRLHGQGRGRLVSADEGYVVDNGSSL